MKIIIYSIVFLIISSFAYAAEVNLPGIEDLEGVFFPPICSTAKFCGNYELECEAYGQANGGDGLCPEDYGDWSSCDQNNYGKYCTPCDPDCGDCGQRVSIQVPRYIKYPGQTVTINVNAYNYPTTNPYKNKFVLFNKTTSIGSADVTCNPDCIYNFNVEISGEACQDYLYKVALYKGNQSGYHYVDGSLTQSNGIISPYMEITNPNENDELQGTTEVTSNVEGENNGCEIIGVYYSLHSYDNDNNCNDNYCRLGIVRPEFGINNYPYNWNTATYVNGSYRLDAVVVGKKDNIVAWYDADPVDVILNNSRLEPELESTYQGSKILNIILARIKTWL